MQAFRELGMQIETQWRDEHYNHDVFPDIAVNALVKADLLEQVDLWDPVRWVHTATNFPEQMDPGANFGDPPITLFAGPRFYIAVFYWLDGTTGIHQHAFSGAFQVLHGGSVHAVYDFDQARELNPYCLVGDVSLKEASLLGKGDVRTIAPGSRFIHSLFHLERPSATIVVRTRRDASTQFRYMKPYLALDPFYFEPWAGRKIQTVSLLLSSNYPDADEMICNLLDTSDFHTTFHILNTSISRLKSNKLEQIFGISEGMDRFRVMLDRARQRHGTLIDLLTPIFDDQLIRDDIVARRKMIQEADHRLFLGLLLNVSERTKLLDLVSQRFGDNPVELIIQWVKELSRIKTLGSPEPNILGIDGIDDTYLKVLANLLKGLPPTGGVTESASEDLNGLQIDETVKSIKSSTLFKSIFSDAQPKAREVLGP